MADIISERIDRVRRERRRGIGEPALAGRSADASLVTMVELLFFAYRDFVSEPDAILQQYKFGRAHHRVLHFVNRYPGLKVAQLLEILKITKQSLARVLRQLIEQGFVEQHRGKADGRERLLHTTPAGHDLARRLLQPQIERVAKALAREDGAKEQIESFLSGMITQTDRARVFDLLGDPAQESVAQEPQG